MTLTLRNIQLDCPPTSFASAVAFWAGALGASPVESDGGRYVHLHGARAVVEVHLQRLDEGEGRIHLDLAADDVEAEASRLEAAGASVTSRDPAGIVGLRDPAGLVLCVVAGTAPPVPIAPDDRAGGLLDSLFIDVVADDVDAEVAFWSGAFGVTPRTDDDGAWTALPGVAGPVAPFTFEVQRVGPGGPSPAPRYHLDLRAGDVAVEAARLESLGARRLWEVPGCITLADPADHLLCVIGLRDGEEAS